MGCSLPVAGWESDGVWHVGRECRGFGALLHEVVISIPPCFVILSSRTLCSDFKKRSRATMGDGGDRRTINGFGRCMSGTEAANWGLGRGFRACNPPTTSPGAPSNPFQARPFPSQQDGGGGRLRRCGTTTTATTEQAAMRKNSSPGSALLCPKSQKPMSILCKTRGTSP